MSYSGCRRVSGFFRNQIVKLYPVAYHSNHTIDSDNCRSIRNICWFNLQCPIKMGIRSIILFRNLQLFYLQLNRYSDLWSNYQFFFAWLISFKLNINFGRVHLLGISHSI